jgi:hypothetical protein
MRLLVDESVDVAGFGITAKSRRKGESYLLSLLKKKNVNDYGVKSGDRSAIVGRPDTIVASGSE